MTARTAVRVDLGNMFMDGNGNAVNIPTICLDARQSLSGAADPWPAWMMRTTRTLLARVVETWEDSFQPIDVDIDAAVLALVKATIAYIDLYPESM